MYTESDVEEAMVELFAGLEYSVLHGPDIDTESDTPEWAGFGDIVLQGRLEEAVARHNSDLPPSFRGNVICKLTVPGAGIPTSMINWI